jgi:2,3-bisphosphoglycerate-independent phosphoglycerate mutase
MQEQSRQEDHWNTEQMRNAETGAPHTVYTCNLVLFMLTGDKGKGWVKYTLTADAEGGTCMDR